METRVIKKTHHSRSISAIRPTKGSKAKKPKPARYEFKLVPLPEKYTKSPKMYHLYADVILLEREETLCLEASLYNYYKVYKHIEIEKHPFQRVVRMHVENKEGQFDDWRKVVDELTNSPSLKLRPWAGLVKGYCERYEVMIKDLREKMPAEKEAQLNEINAKTQKIRQLLVNTYPLVEYKSELRNGQIELTQVSMSEKYLAESGYTVDEFIKIVFQDGLPEFLPLDAAGSSWIAKMRLERFLTIDAGGFQTPEMENYLVMKNGSLRMAKFTTHYYTTFENGIPGFVFFGTMTGRPKPCTGPVMQVERRRVSKDFMNQSFEKEDNQTDFLEMFYGDRAENR